MSALAGFTTQAQAARSGRYMLADSTVVRIADGERVGVGVDSKKNPALVWEFGAAQQALPLHAVATAVASAKTIPLDALVGAFKETGKLDALEAAIAKSKPKPRGAAKAAQQDTPAK